MRQRERFEGQIAGLGSTSGVRVVVGHWARSPFGAFTDAMVERADGHRILLAPNERVRQLVCGTYVFDEARVEPVTLTERRGGGDGTAVEWEFVSPSLRLTVGIGGRMPLGRLLRLVPRPLATSPQWATLVDPVARIALRGVRTRGTAGHGRREFYGATDLRAVVRVSGELDGIPLGELAPVDPPCRFGFSSTPREPSVTTVVTTIESVVA